MSRSKPRASLCTAAIALASATGCGDGMARVTGTVEMGGQAVKKAEAVRCTVTFKPAAGGPPASGSVDESGRFRLRVGASDSIPPGAYAASVRVREVIPPDEPGGYSSSRALSPPKYANATSSGLSFDIAPGANDVQIVLQE